MRFVVLAITLLLGCARGRGSLYELEKVEVLSVTAQTNGRVAITYKIPLESMFFSPGARLRRERDRAFVALVRCRHDASCPVDVVAVSESAATHRIVLGPELSKVRVYLEDDQSRTEMRPNN